MFAEYYRRKKILTIEYLQEQEDGIQAPVFFRFILQILILMTVGSVAGILSTRLPRLVAFVPGLVAAWSCVEISDYIWLRYFREIRRVIHAVILTGSIILVGLVLILAKQGSGNGTVIDLLSKWKNQINRDLQEKSVKSLLLAGDPKGENWQLLVDSEGKIEPVSHLKAEAICGLKLGSTWRLPSKDELRNLRPHPPLNRSTYVWTQNGKNAVIASHLDLQAETSGRAFVSSNPESSHATFCFWAAR